MDSDKAIMEMVKGAIEAGAAGVSIGRNIFQHQNPTKIVKALSMIVHKDALVEEALDYMNNNEKRER